MWFARLHTWLERVGKRTRFKRLKLVTANFCFPVFNAIYFFFQAAHFFRERRDFFRALYVGNKSL